MCFSWRWGGKELDTADPGCSSLTLPLRISHPNLNHVGLRRGEKRGETEDREGGEGCPGWRRRESGSSGREKGAGPKRLSFQLSTSPAPNSLPPGKLPSSLRTRVTPASACSLSHSPSQRLLSPLPGVSCGARRFWGDSPRRRPGASAHEWDSALSAPSRSRGGGGGRPAIPRLPATASAASWASWWPPAPASCPRPQSLLLARGIQVARAATSRRLPGRPREPACARAPDHGGQLRPRAAAAASLRRPPPAPAPPEQTRGGSQRAVTSFHGRDGRRGTERAAQRRPGNPYLSSGRELPTAGACKPGVREARR